MQPSLKPFQRIIAAAMACVLLTGIAWGALSEQPLWGNPVVFVKNSFRFTPTGASFAGPIADGTSGYQLTTDGSGHLSWTAAGGGGSVSIGDSIGSAHNYRMLCTDGSAHLAEVAAQTSGRVLTTDANGLPTSSANLTFGSVASGAFDIAGSGGSNDDMRLVAGLQKIRDDTPGNALAVYVGTDTAPVLLLSSDTSVGLAMGPGGSTAADTILTRTRLNLYGATSGHVAIVPAAAAGTPTWVPPTVNITEPTALPGSTLPMKLSAAGAESASQVNVGTEVTGVLLPANGGAQLPSIMQPVHVTETSTSSGDLLSGRAFAVYIGRANSAISNMTILGNIVQKGANENMKVGICSGSVSINGNPTLTAISFNTVASPGSGAWDSTGVHTSAFTGLSIAVGTDLWLVVYQTTAVTRWRMNSCSADSYQTGVLAYLSGDPSSGSNAFTLADGSSANQVVPYLIAMGIS